MYTRIYLKTLVMSMDEFIFTNQRLWLVGTRERYDEKVRERACEREKGRENAKKNERGKVIGQEEQRMKERTVVFAHFLYKRRRINMKKGGFHHLITLALWTMAVVVVVVVVLPKFSASLASAFSRNPEQPTFNWSIAQIKDFLNGKLLKIIALVCANS